MTLEAALREAMQEAENIASGQAPQDSTSLPAKRKHSTTEEPTEGLVIDIGEKWNEMDEELRSKFVQAVNDRCVTSCKIGNRCQTENAELKCDADTSGTHSPQ